MKKFQDRFRMASSRAAWWDYSTDGIYFITICTAGDVHYFGQIVNAVMGLSELGWVAHNCWMEIPTHFPFVKLDVFVVMPNHIHGIVIVEKNGTPNFIGRDNADCSEMNVAEMQNFGLDITKGNEMNEVETQNFASLQVPLPTRRLKVNNTFGPQTKNLGSIIRGYKIGVKKYATFHGIEFSWQPRYYDRIIRNQEEYERVTHYIKNNVVQWEKDRLYKDL
jgi:hypothetical protein